MITNSVDDIICALKSPGIAAIPTETVYGLAGCVFEDSAIRQIFEVKQRPFFDPLIVHVSTVDQLRDLAVDIPPWFDSFVKSFWPGPLSVILKKSERVSDLVTSGFETVAVRMPRHDMALEVISRVGQPLAAPSANMFGRTSPTTARHVEKEFEGKVLVLDGGSCEIGIESTVIDITVEGTIKILRPGIYTAARLTAVSEELGLDLKVVTAKQKNSPGTLKNHYQPSIPLVLVDSSLRLTPETIALRAAKILEVEASGLVQLVLPDNPQFAARSLYAGLRDLEQTGASMIYFMFDEHNQQGEWGAIWDRLWRAATFEIVS